MLMYAHTGKIIDLICYRVYGTIQSKCRNVCNASGYHYSTMSTNGADEMQALKSQNVPVLSFQTFVSMFLSLLEHSLSFPH